MSKPKGIIHELAALRTAATKLYCAGKWVRPKSGDPAADAKLWEALREALGLPIGTNDHIPE